MHINLIAHAEMEFAAFIVNWAAENTEHTVRAAAV